MSTKRNPFNTCNQYEANPQAKRLHRLIETGYDLLQARPIKTEQLAAACDQWLKAWEPVKQMATPEMRATEAFDNAYFKGIYPLLNSPKDYEKAETILKQALARPNLDDREYVLDRLIGVYQEWGKPDKQPPLTAELAEIRAEKDAQSREATVKLGRLSAAPGPGCRTSRPSKACQTQAKRSLLVRQRQKI